MAQSKISCSHCSNVFHIENKYFNQKTKKGQQNFYCCSECRSSAKKQQNKEIVSCKKCNNTFERSSIRKNKQIFCSKRCGNSHSVSDLHRQRTAIKIKAFYKKKRGSDILERNKIIQYNCVRCSTVFEKTKHSPKKYCSSNCRIKSYQQKPNMGGIRKGSGRAKAGYFRNIYCGSTYELAFLIWHQDRNISVKRCDQIFIYNGTKKYYPDFEIDNIIYEIKGFYTPDVTLKAESVRAKNIQYKLLYRQDIQHMIDYVKQKYNVKYLYLLYDKQFGNDEIPSETKQSTALTGNQ